MSTIFINYRRSDDAGEAGRLFDRLKRRFGKRVFMDVEGGIQPGDAFANVIAGRLGDCKAMVVVIGPRWSSTTDAEGRRRLDNPGDWVRLEIATALRAGIAVFPVLVNGATLPLKETLPSDIAALVDHQTTELRNSSWNFDSGQLTRALDAAVPGGRYRRWRLSASLGALAVVTGIAGFQLITNDAEGTLGASLEVALFTIQSDELGAVFAARRFDSPDGTFADSIYERVVDWLADTLNVTPPSPGDVAHVVVDVPADLASRSLRVERIGPGPVEVHLWDVTGGGKTRLPVNEGSLRTRREPFVLEITVPGRGSNVLDVTPGTALLDTVEFAPASSSVRIGVEEISSDPGVALGLTRVLATRPGFLALSPDALEAMRRTLRESREQILANPMAQMQIRESLGADYVLVGSVVRRDAP